MLLLFAILLLALLLLRVFYYRKSLGESNSTSLASLLIGIYSIKNLFPLNIQSGDSKEVIQHKRKANLVLYTFYIVFISTLVYSILYALQHNGKVY